MSAAQTCTATSGRVTIWNPQTPSGSMQGRGQVLEWGGGVQWE